MKSTLEKLENYGWYSNRNINISYMIDDLAREGFRTPGKALAELMVEFWDLGGEFLTETGTFESFSLNVDKGMGCLDPEIVSRFEQVLRKELIPVGTVHYDTANILASQDLQFYLVYEGSIYLLGRNFDEMIDRIFACRDLSILGKLNP